MIAAIILILILLPLFAEADKETTPLIFAYERQLSQPYIIHKPYASEFKPKTNGTIRKAETQTKRVSKPKTVQKKAARTQSAALSGGQSYSKEQVKVFIAEYAAEYGIAAGLPLCIAEKESGYQEKVISPSGKYFGVFQYDLKTWRGTDESKAGMNILDARANVKAAIKYLAVHKKTNPWKGTAKGCPSLSFLKN